MNPFVALAVVAALLLAGCTSAPTSSSSGPGTATGVGTTTAAAATGTPASSSSGPASTSSSASSAPSSSQAATSSPAATTGGAKGNATATHPAGTPTAVSQSCTLVVSANLANQGSASCAPEANFTADKGSFTKAVVTVTYTNLFPAAPPANPATTVTVVDGAGNVLGTATGASPLVVTLDASKVPPSASFKLSVGAAFGPVVSFQGQSTFSGSAKFDLS